MSVLKKFAGHTLIYGLSTIIARVLNFVLTPLFIRKFPAEVYGVFTNLYSWAALLHNLLAFGMETTFFRFLDRQDGDKKGVFNHTFAVVLMTSILFLLGISLCISPISTTLAHWLGKGANVEDFTTYVWFFASIVVLDALAVVPFAKIRAQGKAFRFGCVKLINILTGVGFNLLFIVIIPIWLENGQMNFLQFEQWYREGWLGYVFLSNLIASAITFLLLMPEWIGFRPSINKNLMRKMIAYSFPILIANISFIINELLDKMYFIPKLVPAEQAATDLGIYGAVSKLAIFLSIAVQAFRVGAEPFFFSYAKEKNAKTVYATIMDYFVIIMVLAMVALSVNIEWLKYFIKAGDLVEQEKYWSGLKIIPVLLLSYVFLGIYTNLSIWYKLTDQTRYAIYISGLGALVTIVFNWIFIPTYSYVAAAWVTLLSYFIMVLVSYFWGQKNYPIPYKALKSLAYILIGSGISWVSFYYLDRDLVFGNLLLAAFAIGVFLNEYKSLKRLFKPGNP